MTLFATQGYANTSVSQIAVAAGISKGLLYNYYESKEALLHRILLAAIDESEAWWYEILERDLPAQEQIRLITETSVAVVKSDVNHWRLLSSLAFQPGIMSGLEEVMAQKKGRVMASLCDLMLRLGWEQPLEEALFYSAFMDGMFLHYMNGPEFYPLEEMMNYFLKRYA